MSNLSQYVSYPGRGTSRFHSVLPGKCKNTNPKISHWRVGQTEVLIPGGTSNLVLSPKHPGMLLGSNSFLLVPGIKWPECKDNSPPSSVEIKNEWSHTSTPRGYLHGVCRDSFVFAFA